MPVGDAIPEGARRAATPQAVREWMEQVSQQLARDERRQRDEAREMIRRQEEARETRETLRRRRPATRRQTAARPTWPWDFQGRRSPRRPVRRVFARFGLARLDLFSTP